MLAIPNTLGHHTRATDTSEDGVLVLFAEPIENEEYILDPFCFTPPCHNTPIGIVSTLRIGGAMSPDPAQTVTSLVVDWGDGTVERLEESWLVDLCFIGSEYPDGCSFTHQYWVSADAFDVSVEAFDAAGRSAKVDGLALCFASFSTICEA